MTGCQGQQTTTPTPEPTVTPAPSPTPVGQPFTPVGTPDLRLGLTWISSFYTDELARNDPNREQDAVRAGATWDRWPFERNWIPRVGNTFVFNWDADGNGTVDINYTEAINHDQDNGLNTLAIINGPVPNPSSPDLDDWRKYVEAIVTAYGDEVDAWEIGNEWGLPLQNGLNAESYVDILRATCEVLYAHGQGGKPILLGSPDLSTSLFDPTGRYFDYWKQVLGLIHDDNELPKCLDAVGVHIYGRPIFSYDAIVRASSNAGWDPEVWNPGVWITEHGVMWQDEPLDSHPFSNKYRQASYVVQQYVLALAGFGDAGIDPTNPHRAMIFYHRFADANPNNPNDRYWGLMDWNRSEHYPSYDAMSLVTSLFSGAPAPVDMNPDPHDAESARMDSTSTCYGPEKMRCQAGESLQGEQTRAIAPNCIISPEMGLRWMDMMADSGKPKSHGMVPVIS